MIIGLTGKSCAGKDAVAALLDKKRFEVIDVDKLGHDALAMNKDKLVEAFGDGIIAQDGSVDRKVLGPLVFSDPDKLGTLNSITHPWMHDEAIRRAEEAEREGKDAVINAALLESMGFVESCDRIILVVAEYETRLKRALQRDSGMTEEKFRDRTMAQKDVGLSLFGSGRPVFTIINDEGFDSLSRQVMFLCDRL